MNHYYDNLRTFFERIKSLNFWQRVFYWSALKTLSYEAYEEFKSISGTLDSLNRQITERNAQISEYEKNIQILYAKVDDLKIANGKLENRIMNLESDLKKVNSEKAELANRISRFEQTEESRLEEYQKNVSGVNAIRIGLENDRQKLNEEVIREKEETFEKMKQTWRNHEEAVKTAIKNICQSQLIEYVKDVPFKGKPDNTISIAGEYVIFDSKSPASDDLENFPKYLKVQTESVNKYVKQENVKSDIFLVVPSNTVDVINQFSYKMGDYNVFIVTIDSLEPIILSLRKIEDYEFVDQLTPDERENICRIIGKFSHTAKRKIMIDYFFSFQFLDIISKCNTGLPDDIYKSVIEFEKAEKLNPPQEKRAKQILMEDLLYESERLAIEARARLLENSDEEKSNKEGRGDS
ncbi:MAG: hypothetical protein C0408_00250 [Odoribacter sp.]|nr:hypothetical protein [Odoribacter sp.]